MPTFTTHDERRTGVIEVTGSPDNATISETL